jgi:formamidopyrimidine-DNA glycosylase
MKAALLAQEAFPGIGNWMADEILWRAGIAPGRLCGSLSASERRAIWREVRYVARHALRTIGQNYGDAPGGWLFHERWSSGGVCPVHREKLRRETIGGRTSAWCARCQK